MVAVKRRKQVSGFCRKCDKAAWLVTTSRYGFEGLCKLCYNNALRSRPEALKRRRAYERKKKRTNLLKFLEKIFPEKKTPM